MGFSYADWAGGVFYPKSLKPGQWLAFYAKHFNAVELDTTFYAVPPVERVRRWRDETPDDFAFMVKTPNGITHESMIDRAAPRMLAFLDVMRHLGPKLAAVLLQFPPSFSATEIGRLRTFLRAMPTRDSDAFRFAVEFRNPSWFEARVRETTELLREHRIALVAGDYFVQPPRPIVVTTDFLYVRWIGEHQRFSVMDHEQIDVVPRLRWWREQIELVAPKLRSVCGYFNNDYAGYALGTCNQFKRLVGEPVHEVRDPRQGQLFGR
jgi:uncharacterized protein YecE (DUF72 family)